MNWKFWKKKKTSNEMTKIKNIVTDIVFPCSSDECLVRVSCRQLCSNVIMDRTLLKDAFIKNNCCPDCGSTKFMEGPTGGMCTNVKCTGCGHWFNFALPVMIERIHVAEDGRLYE